jgi:glc operon protein GlcG
VQIIRTQKNLSLNGADAVMAAAQLHAREKGYVGVITIVDAAGYLLLLRRLEGALVACIEAAIGKARTAARFARASRTLQDRVDSGELGALTLRGGSPLKGGIPLRVDGEIIGGIGASGGTGDDDEQLCFAGLNAEIQFETKNLLTYEGARFAADVAAGQAKSLGVAPVVSVVDGSGELLYIWRPDNSKLFSIEVAIDKARSAAMYRRSSKEFAEEASQGKASILALPNAIPLAGGSPITYRGQVIGAIGVSGGSSAEYDHGIAVAGSSAVEASLET